MKTIKYFAILILLNITVVENIAYSQTASDAQMTELQKKYWVYRDRFFDEYIAWDITQLSKYDRGVVGTNIPAGIRHQFTYSSLALEDELTWGDGTIYLSQYISVLATEYKLFKDNNQYQDLNKAKTLEYLIAALNTFNRLDATAESFYRPDPDVNIDYRPNPDLDLNYLADRQDDMNGFYIRDDVPSIFLDPGYPFSQYSAPLIADHTITWSSSDNDGYWAEQVNKNYAKECSKDQGWHMLLSLALVKECVGNYETGSFFYYGTRTIRWMVQNMAERIVKAMHSHLYIGDVQGDPEWILRNPETKENVSQHRENAGNITETPEWIQNFTGLYKGLTFAFGEAGTRISGVDCHYNESNSFTSFTHFRLGLEAALGGYVSVDLYRSYNHYCLATIIGNVMGNIFSPSFDETFKYLLEVVKKAGYHEQLPLIFTLLQGQTNMHTDIFDLKAHTLSMLYTAPACGPYYYYDSNSFQQEYGNQQWTSSNRLYAVQNLVLVGGGSIFTGDYNGLDYMLLHNLYRLVYYKNAITSNLIVTDDYPLNIVTGSQSNPLDLSAINIIQANNTIHSDADVTYIAGSMVKLTTGFKVEASAKFKAYIGEQVSFHPFTTDQLWSCTGHAGFRLANNTSAKDNKLILSDDIDSKEVMLNLAGSETQQQSNIKNQQEYFAINSQESEVIQNNEKSENLAVKNVVKSVTLFPNPNTGKFLIEINGIVPENTTVELRDLLGKTVYSSSILQNSSNIDISSSPAGIYFITMCAGKYCWLGKVVKE